MKIEAGRLYRTLAGHKVRIYATDGYMDCSIHGAVYEVEDPMILHLTGWNFEGRKMSGEIGPDDIVDIWREDDA